VDELVPDHNFRGKYILHALVSCLGGSQLECRTGDCLYVASPLSEHSSVHVPISHGRQWGRVKHPTLNFWKI
jgi:hypothetical protein